MAKVLMCKANISEGRRKEVLEQVADAVRAVPGVTLANWSGDADHNRAVYTLLGPPDAVLDGAKALTETALAHIDMSGHEGEHPRMGAVDVVPFIPLREIETEEAVEVARGVRRVAGAAWEFPSTTTRTLPRGRERESLPKIRKGQYEALPEKLKDPALGPRRGSGRIQSRRRGDRYRGAFSRLVAFNVNLLTDDLEIAQTIARAVRHINGGYRFVRGMGFALEDRGMVQVSMNLVNYEKTPIHRVLETIRSEAARYGVQISGTELIGSVPLGALEEVVRFYLQTHDFSADQVVETALLD